MGDITAQLSGSYNPSPGSRINAVIAARSPILWVSPAYGVSAAGGLVSSVLARGSRVGTVFAAQAGTILTPSDPTLGGQPSFGGGSLSAVGFAPPNQIPQPFTVYQVAYASSAALPAAFSLIATGGPPSNTGIIAIGQITASGFFGMNAGTTLTSTTPVDTAPHVFAGIFSGGASALYIDSSGLPAVSGAAGTNPIGNIANGLSLGWPTATLGVTVLLAGPDTQTQVSEMFTELGNYYSQPWS